MLFFVLKSKKKHSIKVEKKKNLFQGVVLGQEKRSRRTKFLQTENQPICLNSLLIKLTELFQNYESFHFLLENVSKIFFNLAIRYN